MKKMYRIEYRTADFCHIGYTDFHISTLVDEDHMPFAISISGYESHVKAMTTAVNKGKPLTITEAETGKKVIELAPVGKWQNYPAKINDDIVHTMLLHESCYDHQHEKPVVLAWDGDLEKALFKILDEKFTLPILEQWTPWILAQLDAGDYMFKLDVVGNDTLNAYRLNLTEDQLQEIISIGLEKEYLTIPDTSATPDAIDRFSGVRRIDDYLRTFAPDLGQCISEMYKPLHDPLVDPVHPRLKDLKRQLFPAQAHVATGLAKKLKQSNTAVCNGEMGVGKSLLGAAVPYISSNGKPYRVLVMAPGHLVKKWAREIELTIPFASTTIINDWKQLVQINQDSPRKPFKTEYHIISKDRCKLSYFVETKATWNERRKVWVCPDCGQPIDFRWYGEAPANPEKFFEKPTASNWKCNNRVMKYNKAEKKYELVQCGAKLWGANNKLRRFAPADYIKRYMKSFYDFFIADEAHDYKGDSGQGAVFGTLSSVCGKTLALTGTLLGGYAADLFYLMFRLSPETMKAEGLNYNSIGRWESRYGIVEKRIREKSEEELRKCTKGSSKKVTTSYRRPGISPVVFGRHLLDKVAFLELADLSEQLPDYTEIVETVEMDYGLETAYKKLEATIAAYIKANRYTAAGRGSIGTQLNALLSYPDNPYNWEPLIHKKTGTLIAEPENLDPDVLWPKEERLLEIIQQERSAGRRVYVYAHYTGAKNDVTTRLYKVISEAGYKVAVLKRSVAPENRESWLANRCKQGFEVVISNAKLVETGLDLTGRTNFPTLVWYQTGYNLFTLRQASRRSWRIGQSQPVKVYFMCYEDSLQSKCLALMGTKLEASCTIEGKFSEEGLRALAESTDMTSALAKALVEGMGDIDSAETIWKRMGYGKIEDVVAVDDDEEEVTVPVTTTVSTPAVASKVKVKSTVVKTTVKVVEVAVVNKKSKTQLPVVQFGWDFATA